MKTANVNHCDTCSCASDLRVLADIDQTYSVAVQTTLRGYANHSSCFRCNTNPAQVVHGVHSSDKIMARRDELSVNSMLGHNTIVCDRTILGTTEKNTTAERIRKSINEATAQPQQNYLRKNETPKRIRRQTRTGNRRRGLTPPHRVKSISMATFTTEEIEFIQSHGNELCVKTWLGLWDPKRAHTQDQRDLIIDKYERKR